MLNACHLVPEASDNLDWGVRDQGSRRHFMDDGGARPAAGTLRMPGTARAGSRGQLLGQSAADAPANRMVSRLPRRSHTGSSPRLCGSGFQRNFSGFRQEFKPSSVVMAGLDPAIYVLPTAGIDASEDVDHRAEPGDDDRRWRQFGSVATEPAKPDRRGSTDDFAHSVPYASEISPYSPALSRESRTECATGCLLPH